MISWIRYTFFFIILMILQVLVFDHIYVFEYNRPVIFFYLLLVLPSMPAAYLMLIGFFCGLFYDLFHETMGINAAACVIIGYVRQPLLKFLKSEDDEVLSTHLNYLGLNKFFTYIIVCSFIFHVVVTFLTVFTFSELSNTMIRALLGVALSIVLIFIFDIIFFYRKVAV